MLAFGWLSWILLTLFLSVSLVLGARRWAAREAGVWRFNAALVWQEGWWGGVNAGEECKGKEREMRTGFAGQSPV